mmetsp:Transcript_88878/g.162979  ORF Transcript_88878/g.162979 Transcript_88878/m.162979 type:complete len:1323 (+) Transcript_88878:82-4050(+)
MRFRAALLYAVSLLAPGLEPGVADGDVSVEQTPITLGLPLEVNDLEQYRTRCYLAPVPETSGTVRVLASAVALSGNPSLRGGWTSVVPGHEPDKDAGFETLDETVSREHDNYYICVRTFSAQGCDLLLTVLITDAHRYPPPITMRPMYPTVWPIGEGPNVASELRFRVKAEGGDFRVAGVPVTGEAKVEVFNDPDCDGEPLQHFDAPGVVTLPDADHKEKLCIKATGKGAVSLTAGPHSSWPLLAPAVPSVVKLAPRNDACEHVALSLNEGVSITVTATSEDGSLLTLDASLDASGEKLKNQFHGMNVPGGEGAVLSITGSEIAEANKDSGKQGKSALHLKVCRTSIRHIEEPTIVWLTAVTESGVVTLSDGLEESTVVPKHKSDTEAVWRDFRFLVPGGDAKPKEITISGSSSGKAYLVADTTRFPHDPSAYRWSSAAPNSSEPMIRLTTDINLRSKEVHLIDCRFPCFIYISALAWTDDRPELDTDLQVLVTSESKKAIPLVDGEEYKQRLAERETQMFIYQVKNEEKPLLFTISTLEGEAQLKACATPKCDPKTSTRDASDAIDIGPSDAVFMAMLEKAHKEKTPPVVYLRVSTTGKMPSTFSLVARAEGDAQVLRNGDMARGAVEVGGYDRYKFFVGEEEVEQARKDNKVLEVTIQISPVMGDPGLFVSCSTDHPDEKHHDWGGSLVGEDAIYFTSMSVKFKAGWTYIGIPGKDKAAYSIRVTWGHAAVELQDGMEELGHVMNKDVRTYSLVVADRQLDDQPVAVRANALVGSISICVMKYNEELRHKAPDASSVCDYKATADSKLFEMAGHLAALDIPPAAVRKGGRFVLLLQGLAPSNVFSLRAVVDAPATIAEGHDVVDALAPACCVTDPIFMQRLKAMYMVYVRPVSSATVTIKEIGNEGNLAGATVKAREHGLKEGFRKWAFENHCDDDIASIKANPELKLEMDLKDISSQHRFISFWLEIKLEVTRPLNFTMHIGTEGMEEVFTAPQELIPGEKMHQVAAKDEETKYEFALDTNAADGEWHLRLHQCWGRMGYKLAYTGDDAQWRQGADEDVPLPVPQVRYSGSINADGIVTFKPVTETPVIYELNLLEPGTESMSLILPPAKTDIWQESRALTFGFLPGKVNRTLLKDTIGAENDAELFYTLVAIPKGNPLANPNSSCGLSEAIKHVGTLNTKLEQGKTIGMSRLSAQLPEVSEGDFIVNVLCTLISDTGKTLAGHAYVPYEFNASMPFGRGGYYMPPEPPNKMFIVLLLIFCVGCCWFMTSNNGPCGSKNGPQGIKVVEMDDAYELQDTFGDTGSSLLASRSGNYVPPSV